MIIVIIMSYCPLDVISWTFTVLPVVVIVVGAFYALWRDSSYGFFVYGLEEDESLCIS